MSYEYRNAILSECGRYRYRLERGPQDTSTKTAIIMVNPSTADALVDDHTIRKLKQFGVIHGWGRLIVGNLFALRATDVRELRRAADPIGPANDAYLKQMLEEADRVIVAWGAIGKIPKALQGRWRDVMALVPDGMPVLSIGYPTQSGHPLHPLTLSYQLPIMEWNPPE